MMGFITISLHLLLYTCTLSVKCQPHVSGYPPAQQDLLPPLILESPPLEIPFREGEAFEVPCRATGNPEPQYYWKKNHEDYDPTFTGGRVILQYTGTLVFVNPFARDEGLYQCFAENPLGIAVSEIAFVRSAYFERFPVVTENVHRPILGHSQTLQCVSPRSYPKTDIIWVIRNSYSWIELTDRITQDLDGNLHFANIRPEDDKRYTCFAQNLVLRNTQQVQHATIIPLGENMQNTEVGLMWASPTHQIALRGDIWRTKCIFSGNPTPRVDWSRPDSQMPALARQESFGRELVIENIQFEDGGRYECMGINEVSMLPIRQSFDLTVQSKPYWQVQPQSVDVAETEDAIVECLAQGIPEPEYQWSLNGVPIAYIDDDPDRIVELNRITFKNVSYDDIYVIQCNASNEYGYIFQNAYLNVFRLTEPVIVETPPHKKVAEGQIVNMTCKASRGTNIKWEKDDMSLDNGSYHVFDDGTLQIKNLTLDDSGNYTCIAENRVGVASSQGSLIVRERTLIYITPENTTRHEGDSVKLHCVAQTDPAEEEHLRIRWKKNDHFIDLDLAQRVWQLPMNNSLYIVGLITLDSDWYTCVADNGLDVDESKAFLTVKGPPSPPYDVRVSCSNLALKADVEWTRPWREYYSPILDYVVQFNTTFSPNTWVDIDTNPSRNQTRVEVELSPWCNYTFRVLARNEIGLSYPSYHTREVCSTQPDRPFRNPANVILEGDQPKNLVVFWTPMSKIEQNGVGFKYVIRWRRRDEENLPWETFTVFDTEQRYKVFNLDDILPYTPYEATVKAQNALGDSIVQPYVIHGYSGEDIPEVAPMDISVVEDSINGTAAELVFTAVDDSPDLIHGYFRGYRVEFAKRIDWPDRIQWQDEILNENLSNPRPRSRRESTPEKISITLHNLPPMSEVVVQVRVLNKYYAGPPSTPISFTTSESEPGPPASLDVLGRGSDYLELSWQPPREPNGVLLGYTIFFQKITGLELGPFQNNIHLGADVLHGNLTGLSPDTYYRIFLLAKTRSGNGQAIFVDRRTKPEPIKCDVELSYCNQLYIPTLSEDESVYDCSTGYYMDSDGFSDIDFENCTDTIAKPCRTFPDQLSWCLVNEPAFICTCVSDTNDALEYNYDSERCMTPLSLETGERDDQLSCGSQPMHIWRTCVCGKEDVSTTTNHGNHVSTKEPIRVFKLSLIVTMSLVLRI